MTGHIDPCVKRRPYTVDNRIPGGLQSITIHYLDCVIYSYVFYRLPDDYRPLLVDPRSSAHRETNTTHEQVIAEGGEGF